MKKNKSSHQLFNQNPSGISKVINNYIHNYPENKNGVLISSSECFKTQNDKILPLSQKINHNNERNNNISVRNKQLLRFGNQKYKLRKEVENEINMIKQDNEKVNNEIEFFQQKIKKLEEEINKLTQIKIQMQLEEKERREKEIKCFKFNNYNKKDTNEDIDNNNTINVFTINGSD